MTIPAAVTLFNDVQERMSARLLDSLVELHNAAPSDATLRLVAAAWDLWDVCWLRQALEVSPLLAQVAAADARPANLPAATPLVEPLPSARGAP